MHRWASLACCALMAVACADPKVSLGNGAREYTDEDYAQVLDRWTRSRSLIALSELDTPLTATATFESWDFRWAYVIKYAADYRLTTYQRRTLLEQTLSETKDSHRFYVALYGSKGRWTALGKPETAWVLRLIDDSGNETAPLAIEPIPKPGPVEFRYFPFTTVWRNVFRVRFPTTSPDGRPTIAASARWVGLRFAGAEGNEELRWDLESASSRPASASATSTSHSGEHL